MSLQRFDGVLGGDVGGLPGVVFPADVAAAIGDRARIPMSGTINGVAFRRSTMPLGDGRHCVGFEAMAFTHRKEWVAAARGRLG